MILISKTYATVSQESAENGDFEDTGFSWENAGHSFSEVVDILKNLEPSQSPITTPEFAWFTEYGDVDYETGEETSYSYHFGRDNKPGNLKHWVKAIKAAGFTIVD